MKFRKNETLKDYMKYTMPVLFDDDGMVEIKALAEFAELTKAQVMEAIKTIGIEVYDGDKVMAFDAERIFFYAEGFHAGERG